jgi:hypothetical protein
MYFLMMAVRDTHHIFSRMPFVMEYVKVAGNANAAILHAWLAGLP